MLSEKIVSYIIKCKQRAAYLDGDEDRQDSWMWYLLPFLSQYSEKWELILPAESFRLSEYTSAPHFSNWLFGAALSAYPWRQGFAQWTGRLQFALPRRRALSDLLIVRRPTKFPLPMLRWIFAILQPFYFTRHSSATTWPRPHGYRRLQWWTQYFIIFFSFKCSIMTEFTESNELPNIK